MTVFENEGDGRQASPSDLQALLQTHDTPLYVYDLSVLRRQCDEFRAAFPYPWFLLYFATMANDRPVVLNQLASLDVGACVNSVPHLDLALETGFPSERVQFSSTGVSRSDMRRLLGLGVRLNADSVLQAQQWFSLGGQAVGLRINAASLSDDRPEDRIGMSLDDAGIAEALARERGVKVTGLHVYIGTNLQTHDELLPTVAKLFRLAERFEGLEYLNIGGGVGVNYAHEGPEFDLRAYGRKIAEYHEVLTRKTGRGINVIVEPGRKLTAACGKLVTRITDIKQLHRRRYVTVDASIAIFPRPFHHPDSPHRIWQLAGPGNLSPSSTSEVVVVGKTTFSKDILGVVRLADALDIDDVLVFDDAGSYSQSMETRFLGQPAPAVVRFA